MGNQLPNSIEEFLSSYIDQVKALLTTDVLSGIYLYGSIALHSFNDRKSDIDFIVLLKRPLITDEIKALKRLHKSFKKGEFGKRMDGMYLLVKDCGKSNDEMDAYPYCSEGKIEVGYYDVNAVTWWILEHHGITLHGPKSSALKIDITWEHIIENMKYNMNTYWLNKSKNIIPLLSDEMIEFTTVTISRIICSLEERQILSKEDATEKLLQTFPERWHLLLKEGLRIRKRPNADSLYSNKISRAIDCKNFIIYTHSLCRKKYFAE